MDKSRADLGLEHSARWFEYHADQRQDVFKMFLLVCAGILSASGFVMQYKINFAVVPVGFVAIFSACIFYFLDRRSRRLIEIGEEAYVYFWKTGGLPEEHCPVIKSSAAHRFEIRYKHAYNAMFASVGGFGLLFSLYGLVGNVGVTLANG
ncbi:hypothetical protein ASF69_01610 [Rhizobium sp. Leaf311]|uniref:hypothetical protein n=1 Tax=Rhizobium sp. Leaf311 TaxID=1736332 RepID=UPI000712E634|nr:hypothetical protein [Rhizobium sp. Leaf311]KQQ61146.1 hypothetical protein ASF69_01610 [Rhizobium sp. Leaf311]